MRPSVGATASDCCTKAGSGWKAHSPSCARPPVATHWSICSAASSKSQRLVKGRPMPNQEMVPPQRRQLSGRLQRLVLKELREILRDRRTIITLVVMPILIYPLLAVVFQRFLLTSITVGENVEYDIGVDSVIAQNVLAAQLQKGAAILAHRKQSAASESKDGKNKNTFDKPETEALPDVTLVAYPDQTLRRHVADSSLHLAVIYRHEPDES